MLLLVVLFCDGDGKIAPTLSTRTVTGITTVRVRSIDSQTHVQKIMSLQDFDSGGAILLTSQLELHNFDAMITKQLVLRVCR